jgi:hypothetical protein
MIYVLRSVLNGCYAVVTLPRLSKSSCGNLAFLGEKLTRHFGAPCYLTGMPESAKRTIRDASRRPSASRETIFTARTLVPVTPLRRNSWE